MATEWDDIQRRIGNRPNEIYVEEESLNKFILEEVESKGDMRQYSSLNELDEMLEETVEDEDERMLLEYRKKRLAEMKAQAAGNRFGRCVEITKSSFIDEVSSTSHSHPVICLIFKRGSDFYYPPSFLPLPLFPPLPLSFPLSFPSLFPPLSSLFLSLKLFHLLFGC